MVKKIHLVLSNDKETYTATYNYIDFIAFVRKICSKHKINYKFVTMDAGQLERDNIRMGLVSSFMQGFLKYETDMGRDIVEILQLYKFGARCEFHDCFIDFEDAIEFLCRFNHKFHGHKIYAPNRIDLKNPHESPDMPPNWQDFTHTSQLYENDMYYI